MYPLYFSAQLRNAAGALIEMGEACISEQENSILFNSEFVPLMKLGTPAQIVRVFEGQQGELECFSGKVYLSSRKLLQLTEIDPSMIEKARAMFSVNENIPIRLFLSPDSSKPCNHQEVHYISAHLRYVGKEEIKLITMEKISVGKIAVFSLSTPQLTFTDLAIEVIERIPLKKNTAVLRCRLLPLSAENQKMLRIYLDQTPSSLYL